MATDETTNANPPMDQPPEDIDPIWLSSRTARQIYALGEVEKVHLSCPSGVLQVPHTQAGLQDITRLLSLAASSMALLSLPQTDGPEDEELPKGAERSEKFVDVANEYFERLDVSRTPVRPTPEPPRLAMRRVLY